MLGAAACGCGTPVLGALRILTVSAYTAALAFLCAVLRQRPDTACVILPVDTTCSFMDECYLLRCGVCATSLAFLLNALAMAGYRRRFVIEEFAADSMVALLDGSPLSAKSPKRRRLSVDRSVIFELTPALLGCLSLAAAATVTGTNAGNCALRLSATRLGIISYGVHMGISSMLYSSAASSDPVGGAILSAMLKVLLSTAYVASLLSVLAGKSLDSDGEWTIGLSALLFNMSYCFDYDKNKTFGDVWPRLAARRGKCECRDCDLNCPPCGDSASTSSEERNASIGQYDFIFVAPHADDVAFSCSSLITRLRGLGKRVLVVTVFTARDDRRKPDGPRPHENVYAQLEKRLDEDIECMHQLDVEWKHADFAELVFRHGVSKEMPCLPMHLGKAFCSAWCCSFDSNQRLTVALSCYLQTIIANSAHAEVVGPAGIGQHPDHLLVHNACRQLRGFTRVSFYQDFPYSSYKLARAYRQWDLRHLQLRSVKLCADEESTNIRKTALAAYQSQIVPVFGSDRNAVALIDENPHEEILAECCHQGAERRYGALETEAPTACSLRTLIALALDLCSGMLVVMLACEIGRSVITSACAVAFLSATRMVLVAFATAELRSIVILSVIFIAVAFTKAVASPAFDASSSDNQTLLGCYLCGLYFVQAAVCVYEGLVSARACTLCVKPKPSQPLRILVITDYMPPQVHGIALHMANMVNTMRDHGHHVEVYSPSGMQGTPYHLWSFTNPWNDENRIAWTPSIRLSGELLFGDWDVVHVSQPSTITWPVLLLGWLGGQATYGTYHVKEKLAAAYMSGCMLWITYAVSALVITFPSWLLCTMHGWLTDNHYLEHGLARFVGADRVAIAPSSVDGNLFKVLSTEHRLEIRQRVRNELKITEDCVVWTIVGRVAPEKQIQEAVDALAQHRCDHPEAEVCLIVAGDGPSRAELEQCAVSKGLPVKFLGMVEPARIAEIYQAADLAISCCDVETFGLAVLEALATGLPHVLPHCEIFDELHGAALKPWMYTKGDINGLSEAARAAAGDGARAHLVNMKEQRAFNARIFWSWDEAAAEQERQYIRAVRLRREGKRQRNEIVQCLVVGGCIWWLCLQARTFIYPAIWQILHS